MRLLALSVSGRLRGGWRRDSFRRPVSAQPARRVQRASDRLDLNSTPIVLIVGGESKT
jgi:hypothetical protein